MEWQKKLSLFIKITKYFIVSALFAGLACVANEGAPVPETVLLRTGNNLVPQTVELEDLTSPNSFEGKFFKIVYADKEEAVSFNSDPEIVKRAATVYYHLTVARNYFLANNKDNLFTVPDKKIIVRIEQILDYSNTVHFKKGFADKHNTAYTIGPSNDFTNPDFGTWNSEIWFFKAVNEKQTRAISKAMEQVNTGDFRENLVETMVSQDLTSAYQEYYNYRYFDNLFIEQHLTSMAISVGIGVITPFLLENLTKLLTSRKFYLDTAMIPEAVYHEYSHIICGQYLGFVKPTAIVEGFPNYFSYKISGIKHVIYKVGKLAKGVDQKDGTYKGKYRFEEDFKQTYAHGSFMFSLLIELEEALGAEGPKIVQNSLKYLKSSSQIKKDFLHAIDESIDEVATDPTLSRLTAQRVFLNRGL